MIFIQFQSYPIFATNETTSPELESSIIEAVSAIDSTYISPNVDDQMERFSETSSIELIVHNDAYVASMNDQTSQHQQNDVKIPESHMLHFNAYPGAKNMGHVPVDIVKSFAPVLNQEHHQQSDSNELYSEYVHDPYNLTLQIDNNLTSSSDVPQSTSTIFQTSSYFGNDSSDLNIPPGSEMLFNRP